MNIKNQAAVDSYAAAIENAIAQLQYKDADYSRVEAAIQKAEALNKDEYKDFLRVEAAISAVVYGKNITEQSTVDAMAAAIENAISALEKKPAPTPSEPEQPSNPSTPDKPSAEVPKTGDNNSFVLWASLLLLASGGMVGIPLYAGKRKTH